MTLVESGSLEADRVEYAGDATATPPLLLKRTENLRAQASAAVFWREIEQIKEEKTKR